ncbi:FAD-dependent monooxygenase [Rhodococcus sp. NPDC019627]|uniref:FAD-dependent monooxygenase n=1 Tax=unclassified Rhodococcus (in: high G+C Gram-positive bacteria) TaxID=192944 RepID=UPI0033DE3EFC
MSIANESDPVIVVGASLAGLMTGLALSRSGIEVTMLERAGADPRTGAAVGVDPARLERVTGVRLPTQPSSSATSVTPGIHSWTAVHAHLTTAVTADPRITLHHRARVQTVGQDDERAWVTTDDGRTFTGAAVIGADGHSSVVRGAVAPTAPDAAFAGYIIWLGVSDEASLPPSSRWPRDVAFLDSHDGLMLGYPLPGPDGQATPGQRRLGWAWYDATRNNLFKAMGSVKNNVVQHSLRPIDIPSETYTELAREAQYSWPEPWSSAVRDGVERRSIIGIPIAEYVPNKLAAGRIVIIGDAAHVPSPMTGSGFSASLSDAEAAASALTTGLDRNAVGEALADYERQRIGSARSLVLGGQRFSQSFARSAS